MYRSAPKGGSDIRACRFKGNRASQYGGAIYEATVADGTIEVRGQPRSLLWQHRHRVGLAPALPRSLCACASSWPGMASAPIISVEIRKCVPAVHPARMLTRSNHLHHIMQ